MSAPYSNRSTSQAAARDIAPKTGNLRSRIYSFVQQRDPAGSTDEEICKGLDLKPNTERPRREELVNDYLVLTDSGMTRKTESGHDSIVWVVDPNSDPRVLEMPISATRGSQNYTFGDPENAAVLSHGRFRIKIDPEHLREAGKTLGNELGRALLEMADNAVLNRADRLYNLKTRYEAWILEKTQGTVEAPRDPFDDGYFGLL